MTDKIVFRWIVISVILGLGAWAVAVNPFQLGIDLQGGVTLTYSIDRLSIEEMQKTAGSSGSLEAALDDTVRVISIRINTLGVKDLKVRREGTRRILIQAPQMSEAELASIKARMVQLGKLEFPIGIGGEKVSEGGLGPDLRADMLQMPAEGGTFDKITWDVAKANQQLAAKVAEDWPKIRAAVDAKQAIPPELYRPGAPFTYIDPTTKGATPIRWMPWAPGEAAKQIKIATADSTKLAPSKEECQIALQNAVAGKPYNPNLIIGGWLFFDPEWYGQDLKGFTGRDIGNVRRGVGSMGDRAVNYTVNRDRQGDFYDYTNKYVKKAKCLVLNDQVWSNPVIRTALSDSVQITGGGQGFLKEEQDWLIDCLQSGSLKLRPVIESEEEIDATLGSVAQSRGVMATLIGGLLIVVFMIFYYRFSGMVAVIALMLNLGLMLAMLALFEATITLPGIAGIILTIGMSVDANILIFERIREELAKGKTLVASVQAGFDRAFVTIIDANLTTVITAVILYKYGVGPIKGFAVTLMAGIACSLFTALFVAKTLFATALRREWITGTLRMKHIVPADIRIPFVAQARKAAVASVIGVVVALSIFFVSEPYGLDFTGGTVVRMSVAADSDISDQDVKTQVRSIKDAETGKPLYPQVEVTTLSKASRIDDKDYTSYDIHLQVTQTVTADKLRSMVEPDLKAMWATEFSSIDDVKQQGAGGDWEIRVVLKGPLSHEEIVEKVNSWTNDRAQSPYENARVQAFDETRANFILVINERNYLGQNNILEQLTNLFGKHLPQKGDGGVNHAVAFPKLTFVGPNVVANLKTQAIVAVILSLIALILYIWFRFKELKYGLAAAVAVFHDVIIALGVVVTFNSLGLVHVPINLPIIAGFLTIIGYSLNDTIVLFDRVRENQGNVKGSFGEVVNLSINQTLARTLLTSVTTFVVVMILFTVNYGAESPIEGIAFTLMIGVLVGTYSSIYIASPLVIAMHNREDRAPADAKPKAQKA